MLEGGTIYKEARKQQKLQIVKLSQRAKNLISRGSPSSIVGQTQAEKT